MLQNIHIRNGVSEVLKLLGKHGLPFKAYGSQERLELQTKPRINQVNLFEVILFAFEI